MQGLTDTCALFFFFVLFEVLQPLVSHIFFSIIYFGRRLPNIFFPFSQANFQKIFWDVALGSRILLIIIFFCFGKAVVVFF